MKRTLIEVIVLVILITSFALVMFFMFRQFKNKQAETLFEKNKERILLEIEFIKKMKEEKERYETQVVQIKKDMVIYTKEQLKKMDCNKKDDIILGLQKDKIKLITLFDPVFKGWSATIIDLENLNSQFSKTNKVLGDYAKTNQLSFYVMGGIGGLKNYINTNKLNAVLIVGMDYTKYFSIINNKLGLTIGGWAQVYEDIVIGAKLGIDIKIK